jgi:hypothetical protein
MNVISNEKTMRRNGKIGNYTSLGALACMGLSIYFSTQAGDKLFTPQAENYSLLTAGALFLGFILFQVGNYFMNRFGRKPRPDQSIEAALKGLTKDYTLYNYMTPVSHLLVGPAGVWIIEAYYQRGNISYKNERWHQKGGGFMLWYMKLFGQEGLGRPDLETKANLESINNLLKKELGEETIPVNVAMIFTDERAVLNAEDAPYPTIKVKDLKECLRKAAKANPFPPAQIKRITEILPSESIA